MIETLLWVWLGLVALGLGRVVFRRLFGGPREMEALYDFGLGYGLLAVGMTALGFAGGYHAGLVGALLMALTLGLLVRFRSELASFAASFRLRALWPERGGFERLCILVAILICARGYLGALTPEIRHDPLDYHINFPNLYTLHHGFYEIPWHVFSYMPSYVETLFTLSLLLSSDVLAKLNHYGFSVLCAWCIYAVGRRYLGRKVGAWAMVLWLLLPVVAYAASATFIDLGVSFWAFLALAALLRYFEALGIVPSADSKDFPEAGAKEARRWLLLSSVFSGLALGSKYTVVLLHFMPLALALVLVGLLPRRVKGVFYRFHQAVEAVAVIGLGGLVLVSPWLARNWAWTGNPVYPFFNERFGLGEPYQRAAEQFIRDHAPHYTRWRSFADLLLQKITLLPVNSGTLLVNLALVLLFLLLLMGLANSRKEAASKQHFVHLFLGIFFALVYLCWVFGTGNLDGRFMVPAYLALCLLVAAGYLHIARWFASMAASKGFARGLEVGLPLAITAVLLASYVYHVSNTYSDLGESPWPVLGRESQERYLQRKFDNRSLIHFINEALPADSLILGIGYPARRPYVSHVKFGYHPVHDRLGKEDYSAEELKAALQQGGFTHVVLGGTVRLSPSASAGLEEAGFVPLLRSGRSILYSVPAASQR